MDVAIVQVAVERDAAEAAWDLVHLDAGGCVVTVVMMYVTVYVAILVRTFVMPNVLHVQEAVNMVAMVAQDVAIVQVAVLEVAPVAVLDALRIVQAARGAPQRVALTVKVPVHHLALDVKDAEDVRTRVALVAKGALAAVGEAVAGAAGAPTHALGVLVVLQTVLKVALPHVEDVPQLAEVLVLAVVAPVVEVVPIGVQVVRHYVRLVAVLAV